MIDIGPVLPVKRPAQILPLASSLVCHRPAPASESDLALMRRMDDRHMERVPGCPADILRRVGHDVRRKRLITRLMRKIGIGSLYRRSNTNKRHPGHKCLFLPAAGPDKYPTHSRLAMDTTHLP